MKRIIGLLLVISMLLCTVVGMTSCFPESKPGEPVKLSAPKVTLTDDIASWESVEGAIGYDLNLDGSIFSYDTSVTSRRLYPGETLLVRAVGDGEKYLTSSWSTLVRYGERPSAPAKPLLETPVVTLDGAVASWESIEGAGKYELSIGMELIEVDASVTSYTLKDGDVLIVRAIPSGTDYDPSGWSTLVKYSAGSGSSCTHTDADGNETCDSCGESVVVVIDIYAINDIHGKFCDTDTQPGVDELSTYLKSREEVDDNVIVISSGDMWQGTAESSLTFGAIMTEWMNIIGVVSMTLGNHEYDWGESYIRQNLEIADFPFLAINIYDVATGERADYCSPSVMIEEGGIQVGIIGAIGDCYSSILGEMVAGVEFKTGTALSNLVKAEADRLRALGADLIVYSIHDGTSGYDTSLSNGYVDVVFEGHTHSSYVTSDAYGVYHLQGGGENKGITHAELKVNSVSGNVTTSEANTISSSVYSTYADDPETEALEEKYADVIELATSTLGKVSVGLSDSEVEDLVAKLYYEAGVKKWGDEYDIVLGGGFLKTRSPYDLSSGNATYGDLLSILPFNNQIVLARASGSTLLNRFINTDNTDYHVYIPDGVTINASGTYYVIVDTYTSSYPYNNLTEVARYDESTFARDLLADYIKAGGLDSSSTNTPITYTSIADALSIGASLELGVTTSTGYYIKGTVQSVINTTNGLKYGNLYLTDGNGNTIYVFGIKDGNGALYENMSIKPAVGDEILVYAKIQNFNNNGASLIELKNAVLIEIVEGGSDTPPATEHTHSFTLEWTYDNDSHWHAATCEHTDVMIDFGEHSYVGGVCICGKTEPAHTHTYATVYTYNDSSHWFAATCEHTTLKSEEAAHSYVGGVCICGKTEPVHTHTYATVYTYNDSGHWFAATCEHTTLKSGEAAHSYVGGVCICGKSEPVSTPTCTSHTDNDNNERCDSCGESVVVIIDIYAINDIHGKFCDTDTQPGVDELATYLKSREDVDDNVIIISSGDMWQGTAESSLTYGALMTEWMNLIGVVSMTLGNHEYDWGESYIRQNLAIADFPFLAINIYDVATGARADYCSPSVMIEEGGIQIGIIGAIGDCYSSILSEMVAGVEFKTGSALTALVKAEADRLRALGADLIVYSIHDGTSGYDTSLSSGYVDVVFEGHTHSTYVTTDSYGIYHLQGGGENKGITHAELKVNSANGIVTTTEANNVSSSTYSSYDDDPETEALEDKYADIIEFATQPLGTISSSMSSSTVESLVAKLYYEAGIEKWGSQYNIVLGGGYINTRSPYSLSAGTVTYSDLLSLLPFNNQLVLCSISGSNLINKFYNSSYATYSEISSSSIVSSATYYIVVDTYTSSYAPNKLTEIARYDDTTYARDLLAEYIKENYSGGNSGSGDNSGSGSGTGTGSGSGSADGYTLTSISDALSIAASLPLGTETTVYYYVKGTIKSITSTTWGNLYLVDEDGNEIYVYGLYDRNGNKYSQMTGTKPVVGDEIIVYSVIMNYNESGSSKPELKSAVLMEIL